MIHQIKIIFKNSWNIYVPHMGILVVATILMEVGYLLLLKLTGIGGEFLRAFFLAGMYNVIFKEKNCTFDDVLIGFKNKKLALNLFLYCLILIIGTSIGVLLFIIPGIYFFFATIFVIPLILTYDFEVLTAIKYSLKLFNKNFFLVIIILFIILLLNSIAIFPYGMLSIFTVPFSICLIGELFRLVDSAENRIFMNT